MTICDYDREKLALLRIVFHADRIFHNENERSYKAGDAFEDFVGPLGQTV